MAEFIVPDDASFAKAKQLGQTKRYSRLVQGVLFDQIGANT